MHIRTTRTIRITVATAVALAALAVVGASPASARTGDIVVTGACSGQSDYKLKLGPRGNVIEYDFQVDSNVVGQTWRVVITDNDTTVFSGRAKTVEPSGSFEISGRTSNQAGVDRFVARARNRTTGEICTARAKV